MKKFFYRFLLISLLGVITSSYLLYHHIEIRNGFQQSKSFCSINDLFDCDSIAMSKYSEIAHIPLASFGLLYYLSFAFLLLLNKNKIFKSDNNRELSNILFFYIWLALPSTIVLAALSCLILNKVCLFCSILYLVNIILSILIYICPDRKGNISESFSSGLKSFFAFLAEFSTKSLSFMLLFIASAGFIYIAPEKIFIKLIFEPRLAALSQRITFEPFIKAWINAVEEKINIDTSSSAEEKDFILGSLNAPLSIVEFADYECPHCKEAGKQIKPFVQANPEKFNLVYKNFPLDNSCNKNIIGRKHIFACHMAIMARCAGMQNDKYFWEMNEKLIHLEEPSWQSLENLPLEIGLNIEEFKTCLSSSAVKQKIEKDIDEAINLNIKSTPTIFYNNKRINHLGLDPIMFPGLIKFLYEEIQKKRHS